MGKRRHLNNAPIHEALIDIKFDPVAQGDVSAVAAKLAGGETAQILDLWNTMFEFKVDVNQQPTTHQSTGQIGKRVNFPERRQVLLLQNGSFTFSRLAPYKDWDEMAEPALVFWNMYADLMEIQRVTRIAVRYINLIDLPFPFDDFDDYLASSPAIPDGLPQQLSGFLTRVSIPIAQNLAVVTQSLEGGLVEYRGAPALRMVLDIDVSNQLPISQDQFSDIKATLVQLREAKNDLFFSFLTERTLGQYE